MHISLTQTLEQYVKDRISSGLYNNASEVIREALRQKIATDQTEQAKLEALRLEIDKGWREAERGQFAAFDPDAINRKLDAELND